MFSLLLAGGPFMFATLSVSIVTVSIFIWRAVFLFMRTGNGKFLRTQVVGFVEQNAYAEAIQLCTAKASPLARILNAALMRANRSEKEIRRSVESQALEEIPKVRAGTVFLPQLSNLATLFGLIGTIHGLIIAFSGAGAEDAATRQAVLSQGIAIAFYNTFFGLCVATTGIIFYLLLMAKTNGVLATMEQSTS
ncbi:MAG TPA: MotA/TolQ/ExbB proton channel family protein, partial [Myxococcota bacterium]|nr:MotA/TolQ/ExbB proton channel family protein [Myxococcota bacterium]